MLDIRFIREQPDAFDAGLKRRGMEPLSEQVLALDRERRGRQTGLQELQARRNALAKEIGALRGKGQDTAAQMAETATLKARADALEVEEKALGAEIETLLTTLPNTLDPEVPDGPDSDHNALVRQVGEPPAPGFPARQHFELGEALGLMDFDAAAKLSGARFVVLKGALARLERALGQFMLDIHTRESGYTEVSPPLLVNDRTAFGTGQLPKFGEDLFRTTTGLWLIPTAEVPLTNLVAGEILAEAALPLRFTALTPCFRSEAGSAGRDTRGMLRQHQFHKVELVSITTPEQSVAEHERMTGCAEQVLKRLGLPYRVMLLCAGDTGFGSTKTYDIEVWLPGQGAWREISSCSNCRDFQARRMNARYRPQGEKGTRFVHTLNGSGIAVGRALIAVLENYQQADGSVLVPEALRPYAGGLERIGPA